MSNELSAQELLPPEIGLTLMEFEKSEQGWLVRAEGRTRSECPSCGTQSTARHSRYWRQLQDLPVQGKRVALQLSRWRCRNRECEQAIFRERLGEEVAPWARRTTVRAFMKTRAMGSSERSTLGRPWANIDSRSPSNPPCHPDGDSPAVWSQ
jgi:transposase